MDFNAAINSVAIILSEIGFPIVKENYDGLIVKKLEASNTLDEGRTTNQRILQLQAHRWIFSHICVRKAIFLKTMMLKIMNKEVFHNSSTRMAFKI
jgi:hypothetical protein